MRNADGTRDDDRMRRLHLDPRDVVAEPRRQGVASFAGAQSAIVEPAGNIAVVPNR